MALLLLTIALDSNRGDSSGFEGSSHCSGGAQGESSESTGGTHDGDESRRSVIKRRVVQEEKGFELDKVKCVGSERMEELNKKAEY